MGHVEISKCHSEWRAHANSVDLCVEGAIDTFERGSAGAGLKKLAQNVLRDRQWREGSISVYAVAYDIDGFLYRNVCEERLHV